MKVDLNKVASNCKIVDDDGNEIQRVKSFRVLAEAGEVTRVFIEQYVGDPTEMNIEKGTQVDIEKVCCLCGQTQPNREGKKND